MSYVWEGGDYVRGEYPQARDLFYADPANADQTWELAPGRVLGYPSFLRFPRPSDVLVDPTASVFDSQAMPHLEKVDTDQDGDLTDESVPTIGQLWLRWGLAQADMSRFDWMCVTRSGFGFPRTPNDGEKVFLRLRNEVNPLYDPEYNSLLWSMVDTKLQVGRWYYYTLFVKYRDQDWQVVNKTHCLVPVNYEHADKLWELIPPYYRYVDDLANPRANSSVLRRFMSVIGYALDFTRTEIEGIENTYAADLAPMQLYRELGRQNFGIPESEALGDVRYRRLTARANRLFGLRGTAEGLAEFVATATQYQTAVTLGRNEMLVSDDSEFTQVPGHWAPPSASLAFELGASNPSTVIPGDGDTPRVVRTTSTQISQTAEIEPPVIRYRTPDLLLGRGVLRVAPTWVGDAWHTVPNFYDPNFGNDPEYLDLGNYPPLEDCRLAVSCGIGTYQKQTGVGEFVQAELNPTFYGVPVEGSKRYYLSFYYARNGYRRSDNGSLVPVSEDRSDIRFGIAWYNRSSVQGNEGFSDAFSADFAGYRRVLPIDVTSALITEPVDLATEDWQYAVSVFTAPSNAEFGVPFIEWTEVGISSRYLAAVNVARENEAGYIIALGPDIFFRLGHDPQKTEADEFGPADDLIGDTQAFRDVGSDYTPKVIGEPGI